MKRLISILSLLIVAYIDLISQNIDHFRYNTVYIPYEESHKIKIDGKLNEWDWVPKEFFYDKSSLDNSENVDPEDLDVTFFVAWSKTYNKVYIVARVKDDIINSDSQNHDDGLDININSNMETGEYWSGSNYKLLMFNIIYFSITPKSKLSNVYVYYGPNWVYNSDYIKFSSESHDLDNTTITTYEIEISIWDKLSLFSNKLSRESILEVGKEIGLTIYFNDVDKNILQRDIRLRTFCGETFSYRADESSTFLLSAPSKPSNIYDKLLFYNSQ